MEIEETYTLEENGAYTLEYKSNFSKMISLFQSMAEEGMDDLSTIKNIDTVINYTKIMQDSTVVKGDKKTLAFLANTNLYLKINIGKEVFEGKIINHGSTGKELMFYLSNLDDLLAMGEETMVNNFTPMGEGQDKYKSNNPTLSTKDFEFIVTPNSFERKLTVEALERYKGLNRSNIESLLSNSEMDFNIINTLTVNLPRPATSVGNKYATLSANKKQFKLTSNMLLATGDPERLNFKIVY